jgi:hypothetical protein
MRDRHKPGTLIGTSPGIRTQVSKGRPLVFTLSFFSDSSDENRPLNNKNQGKKAEKRLQLRKFGQLTRETQSHDFH